MAVAYVGVGAAVASNAADVGLDLPGGVNAGDLLVAYWANRGKTAEPSTPAGWTRAFRVLGDFLSQICVYWTIYDGAPASPYVTIPFAGTAGQTVIAQMAGFSGTDQGGPIPVYGAGSYNASAEDVGPVAAIVPTAADGAVIVAGLRIATWTSVATLSGDGLTWAEIGETNSALGNGMGMAWDYALYAGAAPAVTDKTFDVTGGSNGAGFGVMLALMPPDPPLPSRLAPHIRTRNRQQRYRWLRR